MQAASIELLPPCTFYAGLFKILKDSDLRERGSYWEHPLAAFLPMASLAHHHFQVISDSLVIVDRREMRENAEEVARQEKLIRQRPPYAPLSSLWVNSEESE
jgi:hypothetical protein